METLSDKEIKCKHNEMVFEKKDVKEFIKKLKEEFPNMHLHWTSYEIREVIDKLAGKELTE